MDPYQHNSDEKNFSIGCTWGIIGALFGLLHHPLYSLVLALGGIMAAWLGVYQSSWFTPWMRYFRRFQGVVRLVYILVVAFAGSTLILVLSHLLPVHAILQTIVNYVANTAFNGAMFAVIFDKGDGNDRDQLRAGSKKIRELIARVRQVHGPDAVPQT